MEFQKHRFILQVVRALHKAGGYASKTEIQKSTFLIQETQPVSSQFEFVLYKHGPYSFDLESELSAIRSYSGLVATPIFDSGISYSEGKNAEFLEKNFSLNKDVIGAIDRVCNITGKKTVFELEGIATVAWILRREKVNGKAKVIDRLEELKPHIKRRDAELALSELTSSLT